MKKPDLGMIPLFMAGDKHFFMHLNQLHKQTGVDLGVWANNKHEKVEFKNGFAGITLDDPHKDRSEMDLANKAKITGYYLKGFLQNPAYLNRSLSDTFVAYISFYFSKQNFLNIYDYVLWRESEIVDTLKKEYNWEVADDTKTTWRIGDGTASFYNYIYYMVAGFTEHDGFRSNQIREGSLKREEAMKLVEEENQPRFDSIMEYCVTVGIDFDEFMSTIDGMPKLYWSS